MRAGDVEVSSAILEQRRLARAVADCVVRLQPIAATVGHHFQALQGIEAEPVGARRAAGKVGHITLDIVGLCQIQTRAAHARYLAGAVERTGNSLTTAERIARDRAEWLITAGRDQVHRGVAAGRIERRGAVPADCHLIWLTSLNIKTVACLSRELLTRGSKSQCFQQYRSPCRIASEACGFFYADQTNCATSKGKYRCLVHLHGPHANIWFEIQYIH